MGAIRALNQADFAGWITCLQQEPGVLAVTFADRLPGMDPEVRQAEVEAFPGRTPIAVRNLWTSVVGTGFFEAFDKPILAGRGFHGGDRETGARTVIVNEAFARRFTDGATPIGRRLRYATTDSGAPEPWFEIVGMVRDMGMTPTNRGEAPYVFHAASPETVHHAVMGVRVNGDPSALTSRIRAIAAGLDAGLRLDEMRPLDEMAWRVDMPHIAVAGALTGIVGLGLFLSAGSIFSLMSVSIARRSREIGLRAALGASSAQLLTSIFSRPVLLLGTGIAAGNIVISAVDAVRWGVDTVDGHWPDAGDVSRDADGRFAGLYRARQTGASDRSHECAEASVSLRFSQVSKIYDTALGARTWLPLPGTGHTS